MSVLTTEKLSAEELRSLDLAQLADALAEVITETSSLGRQLRAGRDLAADASKRVLLSSTEERPKMRALKIDADLIVRHIADRAAMLKQQASMLQTLMRAGN